MIKNVLRIQFDSNNVILSQDIIFFKNIFRNNLEYTKVFRILNMTLHD